MTDSDVTSAGKQTPSGRTPHRRLGRELILIEAVDFIDEHGRDHLTMRRLGAQLGVEAMALYRYVPGREQLLDGVVEYVMNELFEATMRGDLANSWQEFLQEMAHGVRAIAVAHPRIFPLVATRPPAAPWLRPPLRSLRWVEGFLEGLDKLGFTTGESVRVYRAFSTFLMGQLLLESSTHLVDTIPVQNDVEFYETNDLAAYPRLVAISSDLSEDSFETEFEDALESLIGRIEGIRA